MKVNGLIELESFCANFLKQFPTGGIFALEGDLGAGKTTFVRTIVEILSHELNKKAPRVTSPTYVYHQAYELKRPIEHFDLYRLENASEADLISIGYPEACERTKKSFGFLFVEWPEKVANKALLHLDKTIKITILSSQEREITL